MLVGLGVQAALWMDKTTVVPPDCAEEPLTARSYQAEVVYMVYTPVRAAGRGAGEERWCAGLLNVLGKGRAVQGERSRVRGAPVPVTQPHVVAVQVWRVQHRRGLDLGFWNLIPSALKQ